MQDDESREIARLHLQFRRSAAAAVLLLVVSFCVAFPAALRRRHNLQAANAELLALQSDIVSTQAQIRAAEVKIEETQARIAAAVNAH